MSQKIEWASRHWIVNEEHHRNIADSIASLVLCEAQERLPAIGSFLAPDSGHYGVFIEVSQLQVRTTLSHWSRGFEYPWIMQYGEFNQDQEVLDAGGGDSILQYAIARKVKKVHNIDWSVDAWNRIKNRTVHKINGKNIEFHQGDIRKLSFLDNTFTRIICVSVLEHIVSPILAVKELWRILASGGRLLLTFDVAEYVRYNHNIDIGVANQIAELFGMSAPKMDDNTLWY